jgi:hypothetical protein
VKINFSLRDNNNTYSFKTVLTDKITVLRGKSATGKTTLIKTLSRDIEQGYLHTTCDKPCVVVTKAMKRDGLKLFGERKGNVFLMDESVHGRSDDGLTYAIAQSDNYFVILSRHDAPKISFDMRQIYSLDCTKKQWTTKPLYDFQAKFDKPDLVITEDSRAGLRFFKALLKNANVECISAKGKSRIPGLVAMHSKKRLLLVVDAVAFGHEFTKIAETPLIDGNVQIFAPDSFEWLILNSAMMGSLGRNAIDSIDQLPLADRNLEVFYNKELSGITQGMPCHYNKARLSHCYLDNCCSNPIGPCFFEAYGNKLEIILDNFYKKFSFL